MECVEAPLAQTTVFVEMCGAHRKRVRRVRQWRRVAATVEVEEADSDGCLKLQRKLVLNFQQQDRRREVIHFTGRCTHSAPV